MKVYIMKGNEKKNFTVSAIAVVCTLSMVLFFCGTKMVYAEEKAYQEEKTYNNCLEVIKEDTNNLMALVTTVRQDFNKPKAQVTVDLNVEKASQKSVDEGHSPWRLDPIFVAQVFVSLKISPEGIQGEYPIKAEELKLIQNNEKEAVVEVSGTKTPIRRVYLKRLIRQDATGIWTVVGYDPVDSK